MTSFGEQHAQHSKNKDRACIDPVKLNLMIPSESNQLSNDEPSRFPRTILHSLVWLHSNLPMGRVFLLP